MAASRVSKVHAIRWSTLNLGPVGADTRRPDIRPLLAGLVALAL